MQTLLPGITAERVPTSRLTTAVLSVTGRTGEPVMSDFVSPCHTNLLFMRDPIVS